MGLPFVGSSVLESAEVSPESHSGQEDAVPKGKLEDLGSLGTSSRR